MDLGVEVVQVVQGDRLGRHRQLRAAEFVGAVMAQDHVLEPQQQFGGERLAGQVRHLGRLLVQHLDADDEVADQLALVGVAENAVVAQLAHLADVVQENADQQQIAVQLGIERQHAVGRVEQLTTCSSRPPR